VFAVHSSKPKGHALLDRSHQQFEQQAVHPGISELAVSTHMLHQTGAVAESPVARATRRRRRRHRTGLLLRQAESDYQSCQSVRERDGRGGHGVDISFYRRIATGKGHVVKGFISIIVIKDNRQRVLGTDTEFSRCRVQIDRRFWDGDTSYYNTPSNIPVPVPTNNEDRNNNNNNCNDCDDCDDYFTENEIGHDVITSTYLLSVNSQSFGLDVIYVFVCARFGCRRRMRGDCEPGAGRPADHTENRREQQEDVAGVEAEIATEEQRSGEKLYAGVHCRRRVLRTDENDEKHAQQRGDQRPVLSEMSMNRPDARAFVRPRVKSQSRSLRNIHLQLSERPSRNVYLIRAWKNFNYDAVINNKLRFIFDCF